MLSQAKKERCFHVCFTKKIIILQSSEAVFSCTSHSQENTFRFLDPLVWRLSTLITSKVWNVAIFTSFNCMRDFLNQDVKIQFLSSFIIMMIGKDNLNNCKAVTPLKTNTAGWKSSIFWIGDTDTSSFMLIFHRDVSFRGGGGGNVMQNIFPNMRASPLNNWVLDFMGDRPSQWGINLSNEKKAPGCLGDLLGMKSYLPYPYPVMWGFSWTFIRVPIRQPVFHGK